MTPNHWVEKDAVRASHPKRFDFLGFTHISGKTRRGDFTIHRKTSRKKFQAKLAELKETISRRRHDDLAMVGEWL
jgi:RNA-directed DNA polymerase